MPIPPGLCTYHRRDPPLALCPVSLDPPNYLEGEVLTGGHAGCTVASTPPEFGGGHFQSNKKGQKLSMVPMVHFVSSPFL